MQKAILYTVLIVAALSFLALAVSLLLLAWELSKFGTYPQWNTAG